MEQAEWQKLTKKERRRLKKERERQERKIKVMKGRLVRWSFILGAVALVVGGIFLSNYFKSKRFTNTPRLEVTPATFNFGKISLEEKKQTSFTIKNSGVFPLIISGAKTSCDCTTAQFKIGESPSPIFGMHNPPSWSATLEVEETGELVVFYEPQVHPVTGSVTREVYIFSNDPRKDKETVTIYANVVP